MYNEDYDEEWDDKDAKPQVARVLLNSDFCIRLLQRLNAERRLIASKASANDPVDFEKEGIRGRLEIDEQIISYRRALYSHFVDHAIKQLPRPHVITADDLQDLALSHLGGITQDSCDEQLRRYVHFVLSRIEEFEGDEGIVPPLDFGKWVADTPQAQKEKDNDIRFVSLPNGFDLHLDWNQGASKDEQIVNDLDGRRCANGVFWGECSESAMKVLRSVIGPLIESFVCSMRLTATRSIMARSARHDSQWWVFNTDETTDETSESLMPPMSWLVSAEFKSCVQSAVDRLYDDSKFARRIRNALELTNFADAHANAAVRLSFSVSAMEAIVCNEKDKKIDQLRTRIPAVLQCGHQTPDRFAVAIGKLYDVRSRCLHGDKLSADADYVASARKLAAAVLRGAIEWKLHTKAAGATPTDEEWIASLEQATADTQRPKNIHGVTKELAEHVASFTHVFTVDWKSDLSGEADSTDE